MLSFIIPTLNEEKTIEKTLQSLKKLTVFPYEIIISDGGSTDHTLEIARRYTDKVLEWHGPGRQTIAMGRNIGARAARGEYLVYVDADVIIPAIDDFFKKTVAQFIQKDMLAFLIVQFRIDPEYERWSDWLGFFIVNQIMRFQNNVLHRGAAQGDFQMIRKTFFDTIGGYNESLVAAEDMDLALRLSRIAETRSDLSLAIYQSDRHIRKVGWLKIFWIWNTNYLYYLVRGKVRSKEWSVIR